MITRRRRPAGRRLTSMLVAAGVFLLGSSNAAAITLPGDLPPVTLPPVTAPSVTVPPVTVPPITVPSPTVPPATLPPVNLPPVDVPAPPSPPVALPQNPVTDPAGSLGDAVAGTPLAASDAPDGTRATPAPAGATAGGAPSVGRGDRAASDAAGGGSPADEGVRVAGAGTGQHGVDGGHVGASAPAAVGLGEAGARDLAHFGWPVGLSVLIAVFVVVQGRADRNEVKLAGAPLGQGERVAFRP